MANQCPETSELHARLRALERGYLRLRMILVAVGLCLAVVVLAGFQRPPDDILEVKGLRIHNALGQTVSELMPSPGGVSLVLFDGLGKIRSKLFVDMMSEGVQFFDILGHKRIELRAEQNPRDGGNGFALFDAAGTERGEFSLKSDGAPLLAVNDQNGKMRGALTIISGQNRVALAFYGENDRNLLAVSEETNGGAVELFNHFGVGPGGTRDPRQAGIRLSVSDQGTASVEATNANGRTARVQPR